MLRALGRAISIQGIGVERPVDYLLKGERTAIPMISRDDRLPLLRLISATLDSDSSSILRLQPSLTSNQGWHGLRRWSLGLTSLAVKCQLMGGAVALHSDTLAFTVLSRLSASGLRPPSQARATTLTSISAPSLRWGRLY